MDFLMQRFLPFFSGFRKGCPSATVLLFMDHPYGNTLIAQRATTKKHRQSLWQPCTLQDLTDTSMDLGAMPSCEIVQCTRQPVHEIAGCRTMFVESGLV